MKILHLLYESQGDYFGIGGVGARAYEIYRHLRDRHDITLLCKKYPGAGDGYKDGLRHLFAGTESRSLTKTLLSYAYHAARFVKKKGDEYDVIVEEFSPAIPTFLHAVAGKPAVLQVQGYTGTLYFRKYNPLYASALYLMEQLRPACYRNFIFINEETAGKFRKNPKSRVSIIANGVSPELLSVPIYEGDYVLYFGRIDIYGKGLDLLLAAYRDFSQWLPDMGLVIAGDGRDMEEFRSVVMTLPGEVRRKIEFTGWVSGDRKTEVLGKAAFAVFPSRHEVQPIAVLEAMACGKGVVVSDIAGFSFVKQSGAGRTFKSGDASSLAQCMKELAESGDRIEAGLRGRESAKNMTWEKVAERFEKFLIETSEMH
ncbi:MAG: glycosyltransferase family 4 protein [Acidobacteriota bacterium]